jgi:hypothetical protein
MTDKKTSLQNSTDPKSAGPTPEYSQRPLERPGSDADMTPRADHGEESYVGLGRLKGKTALITGGGTVESGAR